MYRLMESRIRKRSFLSEWFRVMQGSRQDKKSTPLLYFYMDSSLN